MPLLPLCTRTGAFDVELVLPSGVRRTVAALAQVPFVQPLPKKHFVQLMLFDVTKGDVPIGTIVRWPASPPETPHDG